MAIVETIHAQGGDRAYRVRTINDEPVWIVVSSENGWSDDRAASPLRITAKVGRFGDRAREDELLSHLKARLAFLIARDRR